MVLVSTTRPKCKTCGIRVTPITWAKNKKRSYYRSECTHCANVRRGSPISYDTSTDKKLAAKKLGFDVTVCSRCGWHGYCHTHHKNRDGNDNTASNIEILCPNCHMDEHHGKPMVVSIN